MGRPKKYTSDRSLRRAAEDYFNSISRVREIMERHNTGKLDGYGHFVMEWVPVRNEKGEIMTEREFVIPPTAGGLCQHLGISRETWSQYCGDPQFASATTWAREQLFAWREKELLTRSEKNIRGLIFDMKANYGVREDATTPDAEGEVQIIDDMEFSKCSVIHCGNFCYRTWHLIAYGILVPTSDCRDCVCAPGIDYRHRSRRGTHSGDTDNPGRIF